MLDSEYYPTSEDEVYFSDDTSVYEDTSDSEESDLEEYSTKHKPVETPSKQIGTIYKISSTGTDKVYIGSTINPKNRWSVHRSEFKKGTLTCMSKLIFEYGNATFTELAQIKFNDQTELLELERTVMKQYDGKCVNKMGNRLSKKVGDSRSPEYIKASNAITNKKWNDKFNKQKKYCEYCKKEVAYKGYSEHTKTARHIEKATKK
jgi:hypothetical protein